jgi:uncharacterized protein with PQ loop repeat
MGLLTLTLAVWLSLKIGHVALQLLSGMGLLVWLIYARLQKKQWHALSVMVYPVMAVNLLYLVLEGMTLIAHTRYSIPHNVVSSMANEQNVPVVVYRLDPPVTYELGLYRQTAPVLRIDRPEDLPPQSDNYFLLTRTAEAAKLSERIGLMTAVQQGDWVDHKTGTLPRQIELAAGRAALESFSVYKVSPR